MTVQMQRRSRTASPERWQAALKRAHAEGVQVRQLQGSGQWIATSGTQNGVAYEIDITGNVAHGCTCLAGLNGDGCCKHRAKFYESTGALELEEPGAAVERAAGILSGFRTATRPAA